MAVSPWFGTQLSNRFSLHALLPYSEPRAGLVSRGPAAQPAQPSAVGWGFTQV